MTEYLDGAKRSVKPGSVETKFSPCLLASYHKTPTDGFYLQEPLILDDYNSKIKYDGIACTLTQNCGAMARRNGQKVLEPDDKGYIIRKLTPKECFKLQGIKEGCIDLVVSDSQAYKIAGNAISVNVMQSLLRSLYKPISKKDTLF